MSAKSGGLQNNVQKSKGLIYLYCVPVHVLKPPTSNVKDIMLNGFVFQKCVTELLTALMDQMKTNFVNFSRTITLIHRDNGHIEFSWRDDDFNNSFQDQKKCATTAFVGGKNESKCPTEADMSAKSGGLQNNVQKSKGLIYLYCVPVHVLKPPTSNVKDIMLNGFVFQKCVTELLTALMDQMKSNFVNFSRTITLIHRDNGHIAFSWRVENSRHSFQVTIIDL
ncbi:hypothetical protein RF11_13100 [Thelohanellus kitauei]|uniref:Uncharacterized protein n=1 Tax=Thelohanellus kitauei TaxID=669202 RepID=A0A0C2MN56_THEKT|nr:hypothetical protein RF11_13100 [Thelohanellus kitauei]